MSYQLINASAHNTGIESNSVHSVITSPPYWGLRKYSGDQGVEWQSVTYAPMAGLPPITIPTMRCDLGMEATPEAYIGHLILVMREMWRVLRNDGTAWVNLGDSYSGSGKGGQSEEKRSANWQPEYTNKGNVPLGLKPKDLVQIPARFALAAQADGWYVRSDMPWIKRNCMPESTTDRPTTTIEHVYLLAKSENYFFDAEAIKQPVAESSIERLSQNIDGQIGTSRANGGAKTNGNLKASGNLSGRSFRSSDMFFKTWQGLLINENETPISFVVNPSGYHGAHFATWPEKLVEPMIMASTSTKGVCPECGAQWERIMEKVGETQQRWAKGASVIDAAYNGQVGESSVLKTGNVAVKATIGWEPTCTCNLSDPIPATVLDPFSGSGTTGRVSNRLGRNYIGVDISNEYLTDLAPERLGNIQYEMTW